MSSSSCLALLCGETCSAALRASADSHSVMFSRMFSDFNTFLPDNVASVLLGVKVLLCRDTVRVAGGGGRAGVNDF